MKHFIIGLTVGLSLAVGSSAAQENKNSMSGYYTTIAIRTTDDALRTGYVAGTSDAFRYVEMMGRAAHLAGDHPDALIRDRFMKLSDCMAFRGRPLGALMFFADNAWERKAKTDANSSAAETLITSACDK